MDRSVCRGGGGGKGRGGEEREKGAGGGGGDFIGMYGGGDGSCSANTVSVFRYIQPK